MPQARPVLLCPESSERSQTVRLVLTATAGLTSFVPCTISLNTIKAPAAMFRRLSPHIRSSPSRRVSRVLAVDLWYSNPIFLVCRSLLAPASGLVTVATRELSLAAKGEVWPILTNFVRFASSRTSGFPPWNCSTSMPPTITRPSRRPCSRCTSCGWRGSSGSGACPTTPRGRRSTSGTPASERQKSHLLCELTAILVVYQCIFLEPSGRQ